MRANRNKKFEAHKFLDKFQGHEEILRQFIGMFEGKISLKPDQVDINSFKAYLAADSNDSGRETLLDELYRINDMSSGRSEFREKSHEEFINACRQMHPVYDPDPEGKLPLECLAMKIRTEHSAAFDLAYDMHTYHHVDTFSIFRGESGVAIKDPAKAAATFQAKLEKLFKRDKSSDRVKVGYYTEGNSVKFIVYHEKRVVSELVFDNAKNITTKPLRPLQQDLVGYDHTTGNLEIKARFKKETNSLRQAFAEACLHDRDFFEHDGAADHINLPALLEDGFKFNTRDGDRAYLYEISIDLAQVLKPAMPLRSQDVFQTIDMNQIRAQLTNAQVFRAVIYIQFAGRKRKVRVELKGKNNLKIARSPYYDAALKYLIEWGLVNDRANTATAVDPAA